MTPTAVAPAPCAAALCKPFGERVVLDELALWAN